jgi:hypothetical protein
MHSVDGWEVPVPPFHYQQEGGGITPHAANNAADLPLKAGGA